MIFKRLAQGHAYEWFLTAWFITLTLFYVYYRGGWGYVIGMFLMALLVGALGVVSSAIMKSRGAQLSFALQRQFSLIEIACIGCISCIVLTALLLAFPYRIEGVSVLTVIAIATRNVFVMVGLCATYTVSFYVLGRWLLRRMRITCETHLEEALYAIAGGVLLTALYFYGAALVNALVPWSLLPYFTIVGSLVLLEGRALWNIFAKRTITFSLAAAFNAYHVQKTLFVAAVALYFLFVFVSVSGLHPFNADDIRTYYNVPKTYLENGGIVSFPFDALNNGALGFAYVYAPFMMLSHQLINYVNVLFFALCLGACFYVGRLFFNERVGLLSSFFFFSIPWTFWFLNSIKIDFMVTYFITLVIAVVLRAPGQKRLRWVAFAGAFTGFAIVLKYTSLLIMPVIACMVLMAFFVEREERVSVIRQAIIFGVCAVLVFAPWGIRTTIYWGNPLYPFTTRGVYIPYTDPSPEVRDAIKRLYEPVTDRGALLSKMKPWWLNVWYFMITKSSYAANQTGPLFFGLLPLAFFLYRGLYTRAFWGMAGVIAATFACWLYVVTSQIWYMMFLFPLWCVFLANLYSFMRSQRARMTILIFVFLIIAFELNGGRLFMVQFLSGQYTVRDFRIGFGDGLSLSDYFNNVILPNHPNYLVLPMGQQRQVLFIDNHKHMDGRNYVFNFFIQLAFEYKEPEVILEKLREHGVTHVYYVNSDMEEFIQIWCSQGSDTVECKDIRDALAVFDHVAKRMTVVKKTPAWTIYEI